MFTRKDYREYFKEIKRVEVEMQAKALGLSRHFKDPKIKNLLRKLVQDEVRHAKIVDGMVALVSSRRKK